MHCHNLASNAIMRIMAVFRKIIALFILLKMLVGDKPPNPKNAHFVSGCAFTERRKVRKCFMLADKTQGVGF